MNNLVTCSMCEQPEKADSADTSHATALLGDMSGSQAVIP